MFIRKTIINIGICSENIFLFEGFKYILERLVFSDEYEYSVKHIRKEKIERKTNQLNKINSFIFESNIHKLMIDDINNKYILILPDNWDVYQYIKIFRNFKNTKSKKVEKLTTMEQHIVELISQNFSDERISHTLCISKKTVSSHRASIIKKLKIKNRHCLRIILTKFNAMKGMTHNGRFQIRSETIGSQT